MALETTVEITLARDSHRAPMAELIQVSKSPLLTEEELTIFAAVGFGEALEAVMKATQVLDHAGCASLQFAHFT